jgi:hypothetical protein
VDSGVKMRFSLKDVGADVWSRDQTYGHCVMVDVRPKCDKETLFSPAIP